MLDGHTAVPVTHVWVASNNMLGITMQQLYELYFFISHSSSAKLTFVGGEFKMF